MNVKIITLPTTSEKRTDISVIMSRVLLVVVSLSLASAFKATAVVPTPAECKIKCDVPSPSSLDAALALRGGGVVPQDLYLKLVSVPFFMYGLQFLLMPEQVITMHFNYTPDENHIFFARGSGVSILALVYAVWQMPLDAAVKLMALYSLLVGIVYPWNAAYFAKLDVKYPMHYVPETLMLGLSLLGALAL